MARLKTGAIKNDFKPHHEFLLSERNKYDNKKGPLKLTLGFLIEGADYEW